MRVLVTGANGFIGARVVRTLLGATDEVWAQHRPGASLRRLAAVPGLRTVPCALSEPGEAARMLQRVRPTVLLHLAWHADPADYLTSHANLGSLRLTLDLFEAAWAAGCERVVGAGTCIEYARTDDVRTEASPCAPETLYAACKHAAGEVGGALAAGCGGSFAWARIFHVYGPGEGEGRLVPSVLAALQRGEPFALSPGEQRRDWMHVADVALALAAIARSPIEGPVNVCSGTPATLRELLHPAAERLGRPDLLRFGARGYGAREQMAILGQPDRLRSTGFAPSFSTPLAGMLDTVDAWCAGRWP